MISPAQCRAARAWLNFSRHDLADRAGISFSTVKDFESGKRQPTANNLSAIERVFIQANIHFAKDQKKLGIFGFDDTDKTWNSAQPLDI